MSELSVGWMTTNLDQIAKWGSGGTPSRANPEFYGGRVPWVKTGELGQGVITKTEETITEAALDASSAKMFPKGSVAVAMYGATIGKAAIFGIDAATNQACAVGTPIDGITTTEYLYHFLSSQKDAFVAKGQGGAQPNISQGIVKAWPIPLAPLNEQRRLAIKLDDLLERINVCRAKLDRVPQILKRFREAVLEAAVSGRLTEEWRAESGTPRESGRSIIETDAKAKASLLARHPELAKKKSTIESVLDEEYVFEIPDTWAFSTWGSLSEWVTYGFTRPMPHAKSGVPLVTAKNVRNFAIELDPDQNTTVEAFSELSDKDQPKPGDLLLTKDGTIGRAALVSTVVPFCINQSVAVVWLRSTSMIRRYLELVANAEYSQIFIRDKAKGMAIQHLSITDFAQCPVPVPPPQEQAEIVRRVDELLAFADGLERKYQAALKRVEKLTPSVLAKAFRGELVPQDPNDEPASVLLERIKAQREATGGKSMRGKPTLKTVRGRRTAPRSRVAGS